MEPGFSIGVGLTNACNLSCRHCYRRDDGSALSVAEVLRAVDSVPTRAVNLGTGESGLHADLSALAVELHRRGVPLTMTTNGHSAAILSDEVLRTFREVELSIDHATRARHDERRGAGNWDLVARQMARCQALGVLTTIVVVLMRSNADEAADLVALAADRGVLLRVNVYQPVHGDEETLGYDEFWRTWRVLLDAADVVACGEPILRAVLGLPRADGAGCGVRTIRVTPRGGVVACVYQQEEPLRLEDLVQRGAAIVEEEPFVRPRVVPAACRDCSQLATCGGGCASRRALGGRLDLPDAYCPFVRGGALPRLRYAPCAGPPLLKAASACTTVLAPRRRQLQPR